MTTWIVLRAAGIGAYVVLFASVAFGLVATSAPFGKRFAKASSISIHQFLSTVGLVLLAIHIGGLLLDTYMHFGPKEVLVPGASSYRPVAVALGVIGMYGTVLVLVSSWVRRHYSPKVWRALHIAAVPTFILAMLHGIFAGADTTRRWMFLMYMLTRERRRLPAHPPRTHGRAAACEGRSVVARRRASRSPTRGLVRKSRSAPNRIGCRRGGASPRSRMAGCSGPPSRPPRYFLPRGRAPARRRGSAQPAPSAACQRPRTRPLPTRLRPRRPRCSTPSRRTPDGPCTGR